MTYTYIYKTSDGVRREGEIGAPSRDEAFAALRARGIRPIKMAAADGSKENGAARPAGPWRVRTALVAAAVALAGFGAAWWIRRGDGAARYTVMTPQGPVTHSVAAPLPRQTIPGDRARIEAARTAAFRSPAERFLARFAEPGRAVAAVQKDGSRAPAASDWSACLKEPVRIASTDFTETVDLKRIVTGMKREMRAYLAGGGTVEGYLAELERRQRLEISYRARAEQKLSELLTRTSTPQRLNASTIQQPNLSAAYAYWLKANAQLKSMGIYELPLPDALRAFPLDADLE